jgi:hypothetical protein
MGNHVVGSFNQLHPAFFLGRLPIQQCLWFSIRDVLYVLNLISNIVFLVSFMAILSLNNGRYLSLDCLYNFIPFLFQHCLFALNLVQQHLILLDNCILLSKLQLQVLHRLLQVIYCFFEFLVGLAMGVG